jgi:hypothetical protein
MLNVYKIFHFAKVFFLLSYFLLVDNITIHISLSTLRIERENI